MALTCTVFLFLILYLSCINCTHREFFNITRSTSLEYDIFQVPNCRSCSNFVGAEDYSSLSCKCACKAKSSTFGVLNSAWSCQANDKARKESGCIFHFLGKTATDSIKILSRGPKKYKIVIPSIYSAFDYSNSRYRECDGQWKRLDSLVKAPGPFFWHPLAETIPGKPNRFTLEITKNEKLFGGKLIRLALKTRVTKSCVLFKIEGTSQCPVNVTQSSSTQKPPVTIVTTSTKTDGKTTSTNLPLTSLITKGPHTSTTLLVLATTTPSPGTGERKPRSSAEGTPSGLIAAIAVAVIIVIIIATLLGYMIWKRKRGENVWLFDRMTGIVRKVRSSPPKTYEQSEHGDSIYDEIQEHRANGCVLGNQRPASSQDGTTFPRTARGLYRKFA